MAEYLPAQLERIQKPEVESAAPTRKDPGPAAHPLVSLQARAGNQAIARMVQRHGDDLQMKHDQSLQRESEGGEAEEEELQMKHDPIQRESEGGEAEEEELQMKHDPLQRKEEDKAPQVGLEGGPVGKDIEGQINSMRGGGSEAPEGLRRQMEGATGANLGGVRVHEGPQADTLNQQLSAKAFTTGNDIFLRSDASSADSELMAHEMAHVVQQSSGRTASEGNGMSAGAANDPLEAEADSLARAVLSGSAQREADEARA